MRSNISIWRNWRSATALVLALVSMAVLMLIADSIMKVDLEREANNAKGIAMALLQLEPEPSLSPRLELLMELSQVKGVELFSAAGRRLSGLGEPLEIVGYSLERNTVLRHATRDGLRHEVYWPPHALESEFGLAVRLDIDWFRKRRMNLFIAVAGIQLMVLAAAAILFSRSPKRSESSV